MRSDPTRFLCVCQDGNVRSVGLAYRLHNLEGHEAVPVGWNRLTRASLDIFCAWADYIVVMQAEYVEKIHESFHPKVRICDVGPDRYGRHNKGELQAQLEPVVAAWRAQDWKI